MESLENISRIRLLNLVFQSKDFQSYLVCYLYSGNLNKAKFRLRFGEVIQELERFKKCTVFVLHGTTLERKIASDFLHVISSPGSIFSILVNYQKFPQQISKKSQLRFLQSIVLKNFYDQNGGCRIYVDNSETFQRIVQCDSLNAKEKFPFYCLLDGLAGDIKYCDGITNLSFVHKFQVAAICNVGLIVRHLWNTASEDDRRMLLGECKETIAMHLASVMETGDILKWFLEREVGVNYSQPPEHGTLLHIAAEAGNVEAMEVLIDKGANSKALNSYEETPIHAAAAGGSQNALALLWNNNVWLEPQCRFGNTPLHKAVDKEHIGMVEFLLKNGANVNAENKQKTTPLHLAAIRGNLLMIDLLISNGANKDSLDIIHQSPLLKACFRDLSSVVEHLLKNWHVQFYSQEFPKYTSELHIAATRGYFKTALVLLESNANTNASDANGKTPLHYAAKGGFYSVTKLILRNNANVFAEDDCQRTAMHEACNYGHLAIVELLLSVRNDASELIHTRDHKGRTPLQYACRNGHTSVVEYLLNCEGISYSPDNQDTTILHEAAWNGHEEIVDLILKKHPNKAELINKMNHRGNTAAQLASNFNHQSIVNLIQSYDAAILFKNSKTKDGTRCKIANPKKIKKYQDINAKNESGETQLHAAVRKRDVAALKSILIHKDLKINLQDAKGATALHLAVENQCPEIVDLLISYKNIDVNAKNKSHNTPLHCAVLNGDVETLFLFFRGDVIGKVKINPRNKLNQIPLHLAAACEDVEILRLLLKRKVDLYAKTSDDKTALQIAVESGHLENVQCLIASKDDAEVTNKNGDTILHLAIKYKKTRVTEWILEKYPDLVNSQNYNGNAALHFAVLSKNVVIVEAVLRTTGVKVNLQNKKLETPLLLLAANWTKVPKEILKCLLDNPSIDLFAKLPNGRTALHLFSGKLNKNGKLNCFNRSSFLSSECYLKYDVIKSKFISKRMNDDSRENAVSISGTLPTEVVSESSKKEKEKKVLLLANVQDALPMEVGSESSKKEKEKKDLLLANVQDQDGNSTLHLTALTGNKELLLLLLDCHGIDINLKNNAGETALHLVCQEGHFDFVELILKQWRAKIDDETNDFRMTPLALALNGKHWGIVRLLLLNGAKVNIEIDSFGSSPLHFVTRYYNDLKETNLVNILLERCDLSQNNDKWLNIDAVDSSGHTALDYARSCHCQEMENLITSKLTKMVET